MNRFPQIKKGVTRLDGLPPAYASLHGAATLTVNMDLYGFHHLGVSEQWQVQHSTHRSQGFSASMATSALHSLHINVSHPICGPPIQT